MKLHFNITVPALQRVGAICAVLTIELNDYYYIIHCIICVEYITPCNMTDKTARHIGALRILTTIYSISTPLCS